ncbi:MAG: hypothetical protein EB060_10585 [Proteobacteria bacterium]|nr:hypothetical protein [Pseudomonadota bacterium]
MDLLEILNESTERAEDSPLVLPLKRRCGCYFERRRYTIDFGDYDISGRRWNVVVKYIGAKVWVLIRSKPKSGELLSTISPGWVVGYARSFNDSPSASDCAEELAEQPTHPSYWIRRLRSNDPIRFAGTKGPYTDVDAIASAGRYVRSIN